MYTPFMRVAAIHDLSGIGRTSLTAVIPIFSSLGIQVCPLPTAVLSTQTSGYDDFCFVDLSGPMRDFLAHWNKLEMKFDAVYSGFLGSPEQAQIVADCIAGCLKAGGIAVVDPVLGDNGKLDPTMSMQMVESLRWLVTKADCITPNLTEAALLLNEDMPEAAINQREHSIAASVVKSWLRRLADFGPRYAIITSVPLKSGQRDGSAILAYDKAQSRFWKVDCKYIPAFYPGTGDTFTSALTGFLLQGESLPVAMDRAAQFVTLGIMVSFGYNLPTREGIILEKVLPALRVPLLSCVYELLEE